MKQLMLKQLILSICTLAALLAMAYPEVCHADGPVRQNEALQLIDQAIKLGGQGYAPPFRVRTAIRVFWFRKGAYVQNPSPYELYEFQNAIDQVIMVVGPWVRQVASRSVPLLAPGLLFDYRWSLLPYYRWDIRRN